MGYKSLSFHRLSRARPAVGGCALALAITVGACSGSSHRAAQHSATTPATATPAPRPTGGPATTTSRQIALGIFVRYVSAGSDYTPITNFITQVGRTPAIIQGFYGWKSADGADLPFPASFVKYVAGLGAIPMITWQPGQGGSNTPANGQSASNVANTPRVDQPDFSLNVLSGGAHDAYIRQWASAAKAYGKPVYVRLMHEMNDHSYPWALGVNGNTSPAQYVAAWRHIVGIFKQTGASNVQFVWCVGAQPANSPWAALYPGDAYVQWVSIDGYNKLINQSGWKTMSDIFSRAYQQITSFSDRPVMIAETASVEEPGDSQAKASWITNGFLDEVPQQFPRIKAILYFDSTGRGYDYPLNSSPQAFAAFKSVAASSLYGASAPTGALSYGS